MKIVVLIKRVPDTASILQVGPDNKSVKQDNVKFIINPYDEYAIEEALKIKETIGAEVVVVSAGGTECKETIRTAIAMGADNGVLVSGDGLKSTQCKGIAKVLAAATKRMAPDLVLAGKLATDDEASQVPERVAEILGIPHSSSITRVELSEGNVTVNKEVEEGSFTIEMSLPALISVQKGVNIPRYPTLPNILKAKKKEIMEIELSDLGIEPDDIKSGLIIEELYSPKYERRNRILEGGNVRMVKTLLDLLTVEEKVL